MARDPTKYFYELTPDRIHEAFSMAGIVTQPTIRFLNSMENRVVEVRDEDEERWIGKFYRPGRWSRAAILEEHAFLHDLAQAHLPVSEAVPLGTHNSTLGVVAGIFFAVFRAAHGRIPDELDRRQVDVLGELLAQVHNVGERRPARHRRHLDPQTWVATSLDTMERHGGAPEPQATRYHRLVEQLLKHIVPLFRDIESIRLHGDFHRGNVLWSSQGPTIVDFDDFLTGPPIQDIWLVVPGRDAEAQELRGLLLSAYQRRRTFDFGDLRLVEPLRALRYIHYAAWLMARRDDPAVRRVFNDVGTRSWWQSEVEELNAQLEVIEGNLR